MDDIGYDIFEEFGISDTRQDRFANRRRNAGSSQSGKSISRNRPASKLNSRNQDKIKSDTSSGVSSLTPRFGKIRSEGTKGLMKFKPPQPSPRNRSFKKGTSSITFSDSSRSSSLLSVNSSFSEELTYDTDNSVNKNRSKHEKSKSRSRKKTGISSFFQQTSISDSDSVVSVPSTFINTSSDGKKKAARNDSMNSKRQESNLNNNNCSRYQRGSDKMSKLKFNDLHYTMPQAPVSQMKGQNSQLSKSHNFNKRINEPFAISYIKKLCIEPRDNVLIMSLKSQNEEFENFFQAPIRKDNVMTAIEFVLRICRVNNILCKQELLHKVLSFSEFIESVSKFVESIEALSRTQSEIERNFQIIVSFYREITDYIPGTCMINFIDLISKTIHAMKKIDSIPSKLVTEAVTYKSLVAKRYDLGEKQITYKSLSIFPTEDDLREEVQLRANVINGPYNDVEDYIDIQFKLLKEDFISGLRTGIKTYIKQTKENVRIKNRDIFLYNGVTYKGFSDDNNPGKRLMHIFELDKKPLKKIQWDVSSRLIHGSLLLFSNDNFDSYFMGIFEDKIGFNSNGSWEVLVALVGRNLKLVKHTSYTMVEPREFFEPYFHVLNTLKNIHPMTFPMEKYIIYAETTPKKPAYLSNIAHYIIDDIEVPVNDVSSWPSPESLNLNQSQLEALQAALTREFVVIQGPPGTGKTYLGIKLINILLDNKEIWGGRTSSIFVACYRNNAVDQILDSLLGREKKPQVLRLGGRSGSEQLKDNTLKNTVGQYRDRMMYAYMDELRKELSVLKNNINQLEKLKLFIHENGGILKVDAFKIVMSPLHFSYLCQGSSFENWLLEFDDNDFYYETDEVQDILMNPMAKKKYSSLDKSHPFVSVSLQSLFIELEHLDSEIIFLENECSFRDGKASYAATAQLTECLTQYDEKYLLIQQVLRRLKMNESGKPLAVLLDSDLSSLSIEDRWTLYRHWAKELVQHCEQSLDNLIEEFNIKLLNYLDKRDLDDGENIRKAGVDVIGATTTGAARLNKLLSIAKPKIVIIEEAAEVLEAHAIASLTEHCEHLILIGDHKQLRPSPASHLSCVKYHLDVSLFERMITNNMECFTLSVQHRMRPEISTLVVPLIYPTLTSHPSVESYPPLRGIRKSLFFVDHKIPEDQLVDNDSHQNKHEAYFVLALADYLIKQGYEKSSVTILTMYGAQLQFLKKNKHNYKNLEDVEIQVVDNFQGEENDVIILSLVRSNSSTIGFLSKENRVCVALSRARQGFILIGNMETLQVNSSIWKEIRKIFVDQSSIEEYLPLKCETHKRITKAQTSDDFKPLVYGGCTCKCEMKLACGHTCNLLCHPIDSQHTKEFRCQEKCSRKRNCGIHDCLANCGDECPECDVQVPTILPCGHTGFKICAGDNLPCKTKCSFELSCGHTCPKKCHPETTEHGECTAICDLLIKSCPFFHRCPKKCGEECGECEVDTLIELPCGHLCNGVCNEVRKENCEVLEKKLLNCGHEVQAPCYQSSDEVICNEPTKKVLKCSHEVLAPCSANRDDIVCEVEVEKDLPCFHKVKILCSTPLNEVICNEPTTVLLSCGHYAENIPCSTDIDSIKCSKEVLKTFPCGHSSLLPCATTKCLEPCTKILKCGHKCSSTCGKKCPPCKEKIVTLDACGHNKEIVCSEIEGEESLLVNYLGNDNCKHICNQTLSCNHICKGTCGECMQGRVHLMCKTVCKKLLICSHRCENKCWHDFHTCGQDCLNLCKHQKCRRKCGEICTKCMEPCDWACSHYKCTKKCYEACNRGPCLLACPLTLRCGHPCSGLCGEPCPPICLHCFPSEEYSLQDRHILLEDCGHVISTTYAFELLKSPFISACPHCQKPIVTTHIFRSHAKNFFLKYSKLKTEAQKNYNSKHSIIMEFRQNYKLMNNTLKNKYEGCDSLNKLLTDLVLRSVKIMKTRSFQEPKLSLKSLLFVCYYVTNALKLTKVDDLHEENANRVLKRIDHFASYLHKRTKQISPAEMLMFYKELKRLYFIIDLLKLEQDKSSTTNLEAEKCYEEAKERAFSLKEFSNKDSAVLANQLTQLGRLFLSNHDFLGSKKDEGLDLIENFFSKYYPINFHLENWEICSVNHIFFQTDLQKQCPVCSGKSKHSLFLC